MTTGRPHGRSRSGWWTRTCLRANTPKPMHSAHILRPRITARSMCPVEGHAGGFRHALALTAAVQG